MSDPESVLPEWLTPRQTGEYLHVNVNTLYKWRQLGVGPNWHRLGAKAIRYQRADVDAYLKSHAQEGADV
jgi:hypothetical protein